MLNFTQNPSCMANSFHHIAGSGLAFGTDHGRALAKATEGFAQITATTHEWDAEIVLIYVMHLIGGCQHLALIDIVYAQCLQNLL